MTTVLVHTVLYQYLVVNGFKALPFAILCDDNLRVKTPSMHTARDYASLTIRIRKLPCVVDNSCAHDG